MERSGRDTQRSSRVPYWQRARKLNLRGGLLSGGDRSESLLMYRRDALLTDEDRAEWDRRELERLGLDVPYRELEERIDDLGRRLREPRHYSPRSSGGIPMPEEVA